MPCQHHWRFPGHLFFSFFSPPHVPWILQAKKRWARCSCVRVRCLSRRRHSARFSAHKSVVYKQIDEWCAPWPTRCTPSLPLLHTVPLLLHKYPDVTPLSLFLCWLFFPSCLNVFLYAELFRRKQWRGTAGSKVDESGERGCIRTKGGMKQEVSGVEEWRQEKLFVSLFATFNKPWPKKTKNICYVRANRRR